MRAYGTRIRLVVSVLAGCWLAAGPGGLLLREVLACDDAMATHAGHTHHAPPSGPCFCSQMAGGFDQAVSVAAPVLAMVTVSVAPTVDWSYASPFPLPLSLTLTPNPRPPISI